MSELMDLLFDHYSTKFPTEKGPSETEPEMYRRLQDLAGADAAVKIWDAATASVADENDQCFAADVKTGFALAVELLISPGP